MSETIISNLRQNNDTNNIRYQKKYDRPVYGRAGHTGEIRLERERLI